MEEERFLSFLTTFLFQDFHLTDVKNCIDGNASSYFLVQPQADPTSITIDLGALVKVPIRRNMRFTKLETLRKKEGKLAGMFWAIFWYMCILYTYICTYHINRCRIFSAPSSINSILPISSSIFFTNSLQIQCNWWMWLIESLFWGEVEMSAKKWPKDAKLKQMLVRFGWA